MRKMCPDKQTNKEALPDRTRTGQDRTGPGQDQDRTRTDQAGPGRTRQEKAGRQADKQTNKI